MREKLGLMDRMQLFDGFQFYNDLSLDQQIETIAAIHLKAAIDDRQFLLSLNVETLSRSIQKRDTLHMRIPAGQDQVLDERQSPRRLSLRSVC